MNYEIEELAVEYVMEYLRNELGHQFGLADMDAVSEEVGERLAEDIECDLTEMVRSWLENHGCQCHDEAEMAAERSHNEALEEQKLSFFDLATEYLLEHIESDDATAQEVMAQEGEHLLAEAKKNWFDGCDYEVLTGNNSDDENYLSVWLEEVINDMFEIA